METRINILISCNNFFQHIFQPFFFLFLLLGVRFDVQNFMLDYHYQRQKSLMVQEGNML